MKYRPVTILFTEHFKLIASRIPTKVIEGD